MDLTLKRLEANRLRLEESIQKSHIHLFKLPVIMSPDPAANSGAIQLKQGTPLHYFYRQFTVTPAPVKDVSLEGKTAIVTGSNTGIGLATSRQLLQLGLSQLILAVRNEEKGKTAAAKLTTDLNLKPETVQVWRLDLSSYDSVAAFADRAKSDLDRLDIVVLNAGMWSPLARVFNSQTGHEEDIQVNYLSTALLMILLLPIAKTKRANQPQPTHITLVSSEVAAFTNFKERNQVPLLAGLDAPGKVDPLDRMFISKLLGQIFLSKLCEVVPASVALINCASPGAVHDTEFTREVDHTFSGALLKMIQRHVANNSDVGARVISDAVVSRGEETHGQFLSFQMIISMAPMIYTEEGQRIKEQLWKETMAEFSFVNAEQTLKDLVQ
ncbi:NAD(P)-binding protein [Nemania serpens]|nr:NAD(P)-binding protein [Nemania serpens]